MSKKTKTWIKAAGVRAIKTIAQTAVATIGTSAVMAEVNWIMVGSSSVLAALLSILNSIATGLPEAPAEKAEGSCLGKTFVITGEVHRFANRDAFKAYVEGQGGKVAGSVSRKTSFLVTNEPESGSSKNRKAAELGIPILSEDAFIEQFGM